MNSQKLINKYGTPFYHYDISELKKRVDMIKGYQADIGLCYAMKSAPLLAGYIAPYVKRLEVCSPGEYEICMRSGIKPEQILVSGVNKTRDSISRILSHGGAAGLFTIESPAHYEIISELGEKTDSTLRCYIRLSSKNQFGVDKETLEELCDKVISSKNLVLEGIHYFSGTQKSIKKIEKELTYLAEYGLELAVRFGNKLKLEYGPGLGIDYFVDANHPHPFETDLHNINENYISELMDIVESTKLRDSYSEITFEYGRYIAATCGKYYTGVADVKTTEDENYAILDGGLHQITYFGSMSGMKVPHIDYISSENTRDYIDTEKKDYILAGSLCSVNDILVRKISLPELNIGDSLCFYLAGAYCSTEGISLFLSRDLPAIIIEDINGEEVLARDHIEINNLNGGNNG